MAVKRPIAIYSGKKKEIADGDSVHGLVIGTDVQAYDAALTALSNALSDLADPNVDAILFWDDSAGRFDFLIAGTGITITGTTISASGGSGSVDLGKSYAMSAGLVLP